MYLSYRLQLIVKVLFVFPFCLQILKHLEQAMAHIESTCWLKKVKMGVEFLNQNWNLRKRHFLIPAVLKSIPLTHKRIQCWLPRTFMLSWYSASKPSLLQSLGRPACFWWGKKKKSRLLKLGALSIYLPGIFQIELCSVRGRAKQCVCLCL